jgi:hypothetical protein
MKRKSRARRVSKLAKALGAVMWHKSKFTTFYPLKILQNGIIASNSSQLLQSHGICNTKGGFSMKVAVGDGQVEASIVM